MCQLLDHGQASCVWPAAKCYSSEWSISLVQAVFEEEGLSTLERAYVCGGGGAHA
jgi:hypothetical protein